MFALHIIISSMIKTTLEREHNVSTIIENLWFNSVWQVNWYWYIAISPTLSDSSHDVAAIWEYCVSDWTYAVFMNLARESADDTLYIYITRYRLSDWFLDLNLFTAGWYTTTVTSIKYYNSHIYITHVDSWSYWYEDYNITTWAMTNNAGQYTWDWVDINNDWVEISWYMMTSKLNIQTIWWDIYQKNHIRMNKII